MDSAITASWPVNVNPYNSPDLLAYTPEISDIITRVSNDRNLSADTQSTSRGGWYIDFAQNRSVQPSFNMSI